MPFLIKLPNNDSCAQRFVLPIDVYISKGNVHIVFIINIYCQSSSIALKSINNVAVVLVDNKIMLYYYESSIYSGGTATSKLGFLKCLAYTLITLLRVR